MRRLPGSAPQLCVRPLDPTLRILSGFSAAPAVPERAAALHRRRGARNLRARRLAGNLARTDRPGAISRSGPDDPQDAALLDAGGGAAHAARGAALHVASVVARLGGFFQALRAQARRAGRLGRVRDRARQFRGYVLPVREAPGTSAWAGARTGTADQFPRLSVAARR